MVRAIICDECGRHLFDTEKSSDGATGAEAERLGFVFKIPVLYGICECKFFCDKVCCKQWFKRNVSPEDKKEGDSSVSKIKERKDEFVKGFCQGAAAIQELFKNKGS